MAHRILVFLEEQEVEVVGEEGAFQYDDVLLVPSAVGQTPGVRAGWPPEPPSCHQGPLMVYSGFCEANTYTASIPTRLSLVVAFRFSVHAMQLMETPKASLVNK